jgi:hypothetical protein
MLRSSFLRKIEDFQLFFPVHPSERFLVRLAFLDYWRFDSPMVLGLVFSLISGRWNSFFLVLLSCNSCTLFLFISGKKKRRMSLNVFLFWIGRWFYFSMMMMN